ncbi:MAG: ATP-dependent Clp protease proteolytic subunit [Pseudomonadota bacterium]
MPVHNETVKTAVRERLMALEDYFQGDVAFYYGALGNDVLRSFRDFIEQLAATTRFGRARLVFFLNTPGGSVEVAEKMVEIMRYHYPEVLFVVPDYAFSAGTILCMSGNRIYMEYSSALGPIDPQVWNGNQWVPALGYLDWVQIMVNKSAAGQLTNAEFLILQNQDPALLSKYEQARNLTITLLKKWLVDYKFQDWTQHNTNPAKIGTSVTLAEKQQRAEEIANALGNNQYWHSHGRMIGPITLQSVLKLRIDDYSSDRTLQSLIRSYNDLLTGHIGRGTYPLFMNSRDYF